MGRQFRVALFIFFLFTCDAGLMAKAAARAEAFDLLGAVEILKSAGECDEALAAAEYLEGLTGARVAVEQGGTVDSLREVRSAVNALSRRAETGGRRWEAASLALRAVAAASQQERGEMSIYLTEATRLEEWLLTGRLPVVPFVTVHELAGDLWLQLHQFAEARTAYLRAASLVGHTPRVKLGLARAADRLGDREAACASYRSLLDWWDGSRRDTKSPEIDDARQRAASLCRGR